MFNKLDWIFKEKEKQFKIFITFKLIMLSLATRPHCNGNCKVSICYLFIYVFYFPQTLDI